MDPNQRQQIFTEGHGIADDMLQGLSDADLEVGENVVRRGVLLVHNCQNCGRQVKWTLLWGEVAMMYCQQYPPDVVQKLRPPPWKYTRPGVWLAVNCNCNKVTPTLVTWNDLERYVDIGIRAQLLDPRIRDARPR